MGAIGEPTFGQVFKRLNAKGKAWSYVVAFVVLVALDVSLTGGAIVGRVAMVWFLALLTGTWLTALALQRFPSLCEPPDPSVAAELAERQTQMLERLLGCEEGRGPA
jgi:hypothetical protein